MVASMYKFVSSDYGWSSKYAQNQRQQPTFFGGEEVFFKKERVVRRDMKSNRFKEASDVISERSMRVSRLTQSRLAFLTLAFSKLKNVHTVSIFCIGHWEKEIASSSRIWDLITGYISKDSSVIALQSKQIKWLWIGDTSSIDRFYLLPPLHSCILLLLDFCWICHAATYDALLAGNGFVPTRLVQVARTNHFSQIKSRYTDISGSFSLHTGRTPLNLLQQRKTMHFRSQKKCRKTESRGIHSFLLH